MTHQTQEKQLYNRTKKWYIKGILMVRNLDEVKEKFKTLEIAKKEVDEKWKKIRWWTLEVRMALEKERDFEAELDEAVE